MINAYTLSQAKDPLRSVMAVVFERYNDSRIEYKIRHSWPITDSLYESAMGQMGEQMGSSPMMYFQINPFAQVQMCVNEVLINTTVQGSMSNIKVL